MNPFSFAHAARVCLATSVVLATIPTHAEPPAELFRMQSDPKPKPKWVGETIDQGQFDRKLAGYRTPKGFKLEIVADAPAVVNPVGMTFADDGTPYVLEWLVDPTDQWNEQPVTFRYQDGTTRKVATMKKTRPDLLKTLVDANGDGIYETSKEVLRDELPSSILVHEGKIYVTGRGSIRRYERTRDGGPYDKMFVVAQGFCGFHHHQVSGLTLGNDGRLYVTSGDDDNFVEGSDGSRATVLRSGAIFRMNLDGSKVETLSIGWRNPYRDVAFDAVANMFHLDNDNEDGTKFTGCRLMHVSHGADFGWRLKQGARCCAADTGRGAAFGELPGRLEPMLKTGRGAPAGLLIYNETQLPPEYRGVLYYPDVFRRLVRGYVVTPRESTFAVTEEFELLSSDDPLFRPAQMVTGPDGAIYIVDWRTDSGGAGRLFGDGVHGRIYRLIWNGVPGGAPAIALRGRDSWKKIATQSETELERGLRGPDQSIRDRSRRRLVALNKVDTLRTVLADTKAPLSARVSALGGLVALGGAEAGNALRLALSTDIADLRRLAADGLVLIAESDRANRQASADGLAARLADPDRKARRAAALALASLAGPDAASALGKSLRSLTASERSDRVLVDGLVRALEKLDKPGVEQLVALAATDRPADRELAVQALESLRERAGAEALPRLLASQRLDDSQRARLVQSYRNYLLEPAVDAFGPIVAHLRQHPKESAPVKLAALEILETFGQLTSDEGTLVLLGFVDERETSVALAALRALEAGRAKSAGPALVRRLDDSRPDEIRAALLRTLRTLGEKAALPKLQAMVEKDPSDVVRVEALRTLTVLDAPLARRLAENLLDARLPALVAEAVDTLATSPQGAALLAERYLDKKLRKELLPQVCAALRQHMARDPALEKLLAKVVKDGLLVSSDPKEVERIRNLVRDRGDAMRGRSVYLDHKSLACMQCHRLETTGGQVGPDLTRVWDTQSVEKLVEAILEPSKEIKEGYQTYTVQTAGGQTLSGLRVSETPQETVLKDAQGKLIRIPAGDIDSIKASSQSLMPEGTIARLSFDQFIDLLAFLKSRSAQESLRRMALEWNVIGPFNDKPGDVHGPERDLDVRHTHRSDITNGNVRWRTAKVEPDTLLDLRALYDRDFISAYALTYVHSPKAQDAVLLVGSDDGVRVWLDGKMVHETLAPRGATADSDRIPVRLKAGWTPVLARVFNGRLAHGLYLRFDGAEGLQVDPQAGRR